MTTNNTLNPWPDAARVSGAPLDLSAAGLANLHVEIGLAIRRGLVRPDWKGIARHAVAVAEASGLVHRNNPTE